VLKVYALKKLDEVVRIPLCGILPRVPACGKRQNLVGVTRKRLKIGYNLESFSVKSACVGINPSRINL